MILLNNDFSSIPLAIETGRLVFENLKKVIFYLIPVRFELLARPVPLTNNEYQAGSYTELVAVFTNVFLGMQLPLSSYLQVCFCITNDVVMSVTLMYEKPEAGSFNVHFFIYLFA
jgi:sodium/potassium-transporting ATPase subunit alpha